MVLNWLSNVFSPKHVVIIDDDTDFLHMLRKLLEGQKYNVTTAISWKELGPLDVLGDVDLFLLDIFLKTKPNGPQIAMHLRSSGEKAPVCFLSGATCSLEEENKLTHLDENFHFLPKSVSADIIMNKVSELAGKF
ncbi:MAG: response regulator [Planctomycetes bacterium]|nr:response regulator [Planctomycetota bacterium]